jgi:hypothetical protein
MPFAKVGPDKYVSPSGREFTKKQVEMYYATDGFQKDKIRGPKKRKSNYGIRGKGED